MISGSILRWQHGLIAETFEGLHEYHVNMGCFRALWLAALHLPSGNLRSSPLAGFSLVIGLCSGMDTLSPQVYRDSAVFRYVLACRKWDDRQGMLLMHRRTVHKSLP